MIQETVNSPAQVLFTTDVVATSFSSPTTSRVDAPSGAGVVNLKKVQANQIILHILGTGNADTDISVIVWGWRKVTKAGTTTVEYVPVKLVAFTAKLSTFTGVASGLFSTLYRFADTISSVVSATNAREVMSPADNTPASVVIDTRGVEFVQVELIIVDATAANALLASI